MAYAIMRINKCKLGAVSRIEKHHERKKDVYKSTFKTAAGNIRQPIRIFNHRNNIVVSLKKIT